MLVESGVCQVCGYIHNLETSKKVVDAIAKKQNLVEMSLLCWLSCLMDLNLGKTSEYPVE